MTRIPERPNAVCSREGTKLRARALEHIAAALFTGTPSPEAARAELAMALDVASGLEGYRRLAPGDVYGPPYKGHEPRLRDAPHAETENAGRLLTLLWAWDVLTAHDEPTARSSAAAVERWTRARYMLGDRELPRGHAARASFVARVL